MVKMKSAGKEGYPVSILTAIHPFFSISALSILTILLDKCETKTFEDMNILIKAILKLYHQWNFQNFFWGCLFVFVEYLCNRSPTMGMKNFKDCISISIIVNYRKWRDAFPL